MSEGFKLSGVTCVRLTIYANDPSPTVEIMTWASDSMADLDPLGYLLLILLALSHRSEWCQTSPTDDQTLLDFGELTF